MATIQFDGTKPYDMILLGRATVDFNPTDYYRPLAQSASFKRYLGGSPANIAVGLARLGLRAGFIGRVADDAFGDFITARFEEEGIDTSHLVRCTGGQKTGLTFTEMKSEAESSILMYRGHAADLSLAPEDVDEAYIAAAKALLVSGTALAQSPAREAALKAVALAEKNGVPVVFDIDYRPYNWQSADEIAVYYALVARASTIILGSREEYDLTKALVHPGMADAESAAYWQAHKAQLVVIKHGKEGSTAYGKNGEKFSIKPFPVKLLKGFGGGDGYAAAFLYGVLQGWPLIDALEFGSAAASMLVASHACSEDMPTVRAIQAFIAQSKQKYGEMVARR